MIAHDIEAIQYSRPAELHGAHVMRVEQVARRWRVFHDTYTVCTVLDAAGEAELTYRGRLYRAAGGALLLMEPGEVHANTRITPPASFRVLFIPPAVVEQAAAELDQGAPPHWSRLSLAHPGVFHAFAGLHASLERPATALERESRFAASLGLLLGCAQRAGWQLAPAHYAGLARCRDFILAHYARPLTLDQLAVVSAMSRYHLVRAFARTFGLAPHRYQIQVRIEKAQLLLAAGMPAASVAAETGFADQSHFSRHFSEVSGVTPRQYALSLTGAARQRKAGTVRYFPLAPALAMSAPR